MRTMLIALIVTLGVGAAPTSGAIKNTCDLITKAEMETVLGTPMRAPEPQIMGMCAYRSAGDHPYKSVTLSLGHEESRQEWEKHERGIDPDVKPTAVMGIGDAALLWSRVLDARLSFIKGKTTLSMVINVGKMMPPTAETLPVARRLGEIAAPRLP